MILPLYKLFHLVIRVNKAKSAFVYFQLESSEGLCFYSTLESKKGQSYRDIKLSVPICFKKQLKELLDCLPVEIISKENY